VNTSSLAANGNGTSASFGGGVYLDNHLAASAKSITIKGVNTFNGNYESGLYVQSKGVIAAANVSASDNIIGTGANLDNGYGVAAALTLTGTNVFTGNGDDGLYVNSAGNVGLAKVYASGNGVEGLDVTSTGGAVAVTCGSFINNTGFGVRASTPGTLTLTSVLTAGNIAGPTDLTYGTLTQVRTCTLP
jgi:hypothetical protein